MPRAFASYQVAFKILLRRGRKILFLKTPNNKKWDLPGGRVDAVEDRIPLEKILAREVREELGRSVRYRLGGPLLQYRRPVAKFNTIVLITVYEARYLAGRIRLSFEHGEYRWLDPKEFKGRPNDFFSREEYRAFRRHFGWR